MTSTTFLLILLAVGLVSGGQILFKYVSLIISSGIPVFTNKVYFFTALAFLVSGSSSIIWIYLLRNIELSKAYPFMAMSFVLVPVLGKLFYGDHLSLLYFLGTALILMGIIVITKLG